MVNKNDIVSTNMATFLDGQLKSGLKAFSENEA